MPLPGRLGVESRLCSGYVASSVGGAGLRPGSASRQLSWGPRVVETGIGGSSDEKRDLDFFSGETAVIAAEALVEATG